MVNRLLQNDTALKEFTDSIKGQVILPSDKNYEDARKVWNALYDKYPALLVLCADSSDVSKAVKFAQKQKMRLSVRGGGHDFAGLSVCDNGLVVDLALMKEILIDPVTKTALVQGGATWGDFDSKAQEHGLATTGGTVSTIGIAGLTLGGGTGYLARKYGLTIDNLLEVEIVTADGEHVTADSNVNQDLYWAVRGGGGNFGIVTSFKYQLHNVGPEVLTFQAFYPYKDLKYLLKFYRELMQTAPDELQCYMFIMHAPPVAPFPEAYQGKKVCAFVASFVGDKSEGSNALRPLEEVGEPFLKFSQPIKYTDLQKSFDAGTPKGLRWYSRAHYLPALTDAALEQLEKHTKQLLGAYTMVYFEPMGGKINSRERSATAFPHRNAAFALHILGGWDNAASDNETITWVNEFHHAMQEFGSGGVYVNLLSHDEEERVKSAAYQENYARLSAIKAEWDPENVFRINHNIKPKS